MTALETLIPTVNNFDIGVDPSLCKNKELSKRTHSKESATRKKVDRKLVDLGWIIDEEKSDCNVFTERAKTEEQNKKFEGHEPDYVLYESKTDTPIAIIETKRKGENLEKALQDAKKKYAKPLGVKIIFAYDGGLFKTLHLIDGNELKINNKPVQNFLSESELRKFLDKSSVDDEIKTVKHTRAELIKIFRDSNDLLRKEGLREGVERFTEFSNILFLKYISEIEERNERSGNNRRVSEDLSWDEIKNYDEKKRIKHINNTIFKELAGLYGIEDKTIFKDKLLIKNFKTLTEIINKLSKIDLLNAESDVGGDAFEYFLKESVTVGNDLGEYFTPRHIINMMIDLVQPKIGERIYDPACGTGGFLIASFEKLRLMIGENNETDLKKLRKDLLFGREITSTYKIAKMNMILHGDGHNNIRQMDSLAFPIKDAKKYDVVFSNIPYSQETEHGSSYPIETRNADVIFMLHILDSLNDKGRAAVIVPQGFLFRTGIVRKARKYLLENANVKAIISLPSGVFKPYTGVSTAIICFEKGSKTEKTWFYHMKSDGYTLDDKRNLIDGVGDIADIKEKFKKFSISKQSHLIDFEIIKQNKFNLNVARYVDASEPEVRIDIQKTIDNLMKINKQREELELAVTNDLCSLGFKVLKNEK